jgi:GntR family transcriptional repressor for pyruvate dehydrogenase complex
MRQGDGTYVSSLDVEKLIEPFNYFLTMDYPSLAQLFEVRRVLELAATELAARRATDEAIQDLEDCLQRAIKCKDDPDAFLEADIELHEGIATAAGNPLLLRFVTSLRVIGKASRTRTARIPGVIEMTIKDHAKIVETIKKRDPLAAKRAMSDHLEYIEKSIQADFFSG